MNQTKFAQLIQSQKPVVVEFWAPWCGPCKVMNPYYVRAEKEYQGQVKLVRVNVDESPDLARSLHIFSIPTVLVYKDGRQIAKKTGAMSYENLLKIFEAGLHETPQSTLGISQADRWIRILIAIALVALAFITGKQFVFLVPAGLFFFWAVYDRCPIWRAVTHWVGQWTSKEKAPTQNQN